jgi:hypothetical protein
MGYTAYARGKTHDFWFGTGSTPVPPTTLYMALFTGDPESGGAELSGNGYGRVAVARGTANFERVGSDTVRNKVAITFAGPSPAAHPTTTHAGFFSAASGGDPIASGALTVPRTWTVGVSQVFNQNAVEVTLRRPS